MDIKDTSKIFQEDLSKTKSLKELDNLKIKYLGRQSILNKLFKKISTSNASEKKKIGEELNALKKQIEEHLLKKQSELLRNEEKNEVADITLPGRPYPKGNIHPVSIAIEEIVSIFGEIGFLRQSYPEVEWEYFAFDSLNMPEGHPARDDFETFFIDAPAQLNLGKIALTPHTSSGQVREMRRVGKPPIRMINIAKCYRPNWSTVHIPMFHQFEGLVVDKGINITHLKGTIDYFAKEFFGEKRSIRLRPFHFQFTEPSFEVDITCGVCLGTGYVRSKVRCKVCKSGWLELGGAGLVHPYVLKEGGINPEKYSGWAFGLGVERVFMMKEGLKLDDIRILYSGDIRFLEQF